MVICSFVALFMLATVKVISVSGNNEYNGQALRKQLNNGKFQPVVDVLLLLGSYAQVLILKKWIWKFGF